MIALPSPTNDRCVPSERHANIGGPMSRTRSEHVVSTLLGRVPSETGYQPTLMAESGEFHERIRDSQGDGGSITSIEAMRPVSAIISMQSCASR